MDSSEDTKTPNSDTQPEQNDLMPPPDDESKSSDHGNEDTDSQTPAREEATNDEGLAPVAQPPDETADDSMADSHDGHTNHQAQPSMAMPMMADPNAMQATNEAANIKPVHPHRNNRKFAVLMILIIGLLLAGIAVYVYLSTSKNTAELNSSLPTKSSTAGNSETDSQSKTTPATTKDVDAASSQVDQTVQSLNDNSDLAEDKISDQTLGIQ